MNTTLRIHQVKALEMLRASLRAGKKRPMISAPTGFGKTILGAAIVEGALRKGKRVLFTVPALSLVDQTMEKLWQNGITDVGVIQGNHAMTNWARPVQVASVQTLMKRTPPQSDVVMIDEAHRWFGFYEKWFMEPSWQGVPFVGLSATPWTKGLGKYYDDLIVAATTQDLINEGFLSPFRVFAPSHPDLSQVRTIAGEYHEGDLSGAMQEAGLVADVLETWLRRGENRSTIGFAVDRAHARTLVERFTAAGVATGYIDANTPVDERNEIARKFADGDLRVVWNVGCLTTGIDWDVRCIIMARPTKSSMLFVQSVGRGLRTAETKDDCLILDHSDNHLRLGFVTDLHHDALDDGRPKAKGHVERKVQLPKECPKCAYLKPPRTSVCPSCNFKTEFTGEAIEEQKGELFQLDKKRYKPTATVSEKAAFFGQLKYVANQRGYNPGWAANKFREKFGVWPRGLDDTPMFEPLNSTSAWLHSRQIAWAKSKKNVQVSHA